MTTQAPLSVELRGLSKSYNGVAANADINLAVHRGTIHAIVGENGAGKSTAMKMLYGMVSPDDGHILINGVTRHWRSPWDAIKAGIGMVHQHFMLAEPLTALDNILVGAERFGRNKKFGLNVFGPISRHSARKKIASLGAAYGLQIPLDTPVSQLPIGMRQRIEIVKLLFRDADILILDEPTAVLTPLEADALFENLKRLRAEGKTILIITHKLREVLANTEHVTVFRGGLTVGDVPTATATAESLATLMVGHRVELKVDVAKQLPSTKVMLEIKDLTLTSSDKRRTRPHLDKINLRINAGEIVGIAGVHGNGQNHLLRTLIRNLNPATITSGSISMLGQNVMHRSTLEVKSLGVAYIPDDRHADGLLLHGDALENLLLGFQYRWPFTNRWGLIDWKLIRRHAPAIIEAFDIRPRELDIPLRAYSGGNQQKLIIAREFAMAKLGADAKDDLPRLIIAAEPTRGVDVGAIASIHGRLLEARRHGAGILLVSSDLDEVLNLSDRVHIMYEGRLVHAFQRGECAQETIGMYMGGVMKNSDILQSEQDQP